MVESLATVKQAFHIEFLCDRPGRLPNAFNCSIFCFVLFVEHTWSEQQRSLISFDCLTTKLSKFSREGLYISTFSQSDDPEHLFFSDPPLFEP